MIRIHKANNSIEAEAVRQYLEQKGIRAHYDVPITTGLGPTQIQIFIDDENHSPELEKEIQKLTDKRLSHLRLVSEENATVRMGWMTRLKKFFWPRSGSM